MRTTQISLQLYKDFTQQELREKGLQLSAAVRHYNEVELRKAEASKEYAEELKEIRAAQFNLSEEIRNGRELRLTECAVLYHVPQVGMKTITRLDTGEIVREEAMTPSELQELLFDESKPDDTEHSEAANA